MGMGVFHPSSLWLLLIVVARYLFCEVASSSNRAPPRVRRQRVCRLFRSACLPFLPSLPLRKWRCTSIYLNSRLKTRKNPQCLAGKGQKGKERKGRRRNGQKEEEDGTAHASL